MNPLWQEYVGKCADVLQAELRGVSRSHAIRIGRKLLRIGQTYEKRKQQETKKEDGKGPGDNQSVHD